MQPEVGGYPYLLSDIVTENERWVPDEPALIFQEKVTTWAQFAADMRRIQRGLASLGVVRGSRVAVLDRNSDTYVILGYALAGMGAVLVPINMWLRDSEVAYILASAQSGILLTSAEFEAGARAAMADLVERPRLILRDEQRDDALFWEDMLQAGGDTPVSQPAGWDDPHLILYTSGTTGRPKGAVISHRRTVLDTMNVLSAFGVGRFDRFFCYMPLFHTGAWDYLKLFFMQRGSAVIAERFDPETAVVALERHRCNAMFGVPIVLRQMIESAVWQTADMSSMRLIAYSNYDPSTLIVDVAKAFRERGADRLGIANAYGLTEGGCYICINRPEDAMQKPLSIGVPVPGVRVALLRDDLSHADPGELGEICVRSPALMSGYLNQPESTADAFRGGWLHTGDIGRVDEDGFFHLVDRKKDMIRSGGENIFAKEVELVVIEHPIVSEVAVFGLPDDDYGERVVAAVVVNTGAMVSEDELKAFVRERIAGFKTPRQIVFVPALPKTPAGKIKKHEVRQSVIDALAGDGAGS